MNSTFYAVLGLVLKHGLLAFIYLLIRSRLKEDTVQKRSVLTLNLIFVGLITQATLFRMFKVAIPIVWCIIFYIIYQKHFSFETYKLLLTNISKSIIFGIISGVLFSAVLYSLVLLDLALPLGQDLSILDHNLLLLLLVQALAEEILNRGFLLGFLERIFSSRTANIIQSLVFAVTHVARYLFSGNWILLPLLFIFGIIWGVITIRYRTVLGSWIGHSLFNLITLFIPSI